LCLLSLSRDSRGTSYQKESGINSNDYDVFTSPLADFQQEVQAAGLEERVHYLHHGDTYTFTVASPHAAQTVR
jgi:hypothetical protein